MNFQTYIDQTWGFHSNEPEKAVSSFVQGSALAENSDQVGQLAHLAGHVYGEHLGKWTEGLQFMDQLGKHPKLAINSEGFKIWQRFKNSLEISSGKELNLSELSVSEQIRVFALSSSGITRQNADRASEFLNRALQLAEGLPKEDPANRSLAIAGNQISAALEEIAAAKKDLDLMIFAAKIGRKYWEIAGTWKELERAEYRLARSYWKADQAEQGLVHAKECIEICTENSALALEFFFAYEVLALLEKKLNNNLHYEMGKAQMEKYFFMLTEEEKSWAEPILKTL